MSGIYILGGSQTDFARNWAREGRDIYALFEETLREAVANAIRHGNSLDADKSVQVELGVDGEEVVIEVRDEGVGFDPGSVPDPLQGDNLLRANGRGILLMQEFMDEIEYTFEPGRGTELRMRKRLSAPRPDSERQEEENR